MATKCTGAEIKRFFEDPDYWPEDGLDSTYYDEAEILVNGTPEEDFSHLDVAPNATVEVLSGYVVGRVVGPGEPDLATYLKRWLKAQKTKTLVVECPAEKLEAVKAAIKAAGGKVLK